MCLNILFTMIFYLVNGTIGKMDSDMKISFLIPNDDGTPHSLECIKQISPNEFLIKASIEDRQNPLTHAVSRLDLICLNKSDQAETITLHLDLSGDGVRTNFNDNMWGGMPSRDFIFIKPNDKHWKQIDGKTNSWRHLR